MERFEVNFEVRGADIGFEKSVSNDHAAESGIQETEVVIRTKIEYPFSARDDVGDLRALDYSFGFEKTGCFDF